MDDPASSLLALFAGEAASSPDFVTVLFKLAAVLFCVAINGYFVGAEFALVAVRRPSWKRGLPPAASAPHQRSGFSTIQRSSSTRHNWESPSRRWRWGGSVNRRSPHWSSHLRRRFCLDPQATYLAHVIAIIFAFSVITFLHMVLGELLPKMFALERAESLALFASRPLEIFAKILSRGRLWIFNKTGALLARLFGLKESLQHNAVYSEEELRGLIDISRESGHLRAEERRLIHRVFEFSDTLVREAMVPRTEMAAISIDCSLEDIRDAFQKHGYSRLPGLRRLAGQRRRFHSQQRLDAVPAEA